jgi:hypothetical protein
MGIPVMLLPLGVYPRCKFSENILTRVPDSAKPVNAQTRIRCAG